MGDKKSSKKMWVALLLILVVIIGVVIMEFLAKEEASENPRQQQEKQDESNEDTSSKDSKTDEETENTEEDETKSELIDADKAQALVPSNGNGGYVEDESYEKEEIVCSETAVFTGQYVEDGRDELVENVAAIQVTNNSDQYLEFSTLLFEIDGQTATFVATGIPPGKTAWVLEKTRMVVDGPDGFVYKGSTTSFRENVVSTVKDISISANGNMLTATNQTKNDLESLVVYYKVLHTDGKYLGGITYVVDFGSIKAGESAETLAGHYKEGSTEIVRIDCK